jgi:hypothetical protein
MIFARAIDVEVPKAYHGDRQRLPGDPVANMIVECQLREAIYIRLFSTMSG